jgi:hypothetical protein
MASHVLGHTGIRFVAHSCDGMRIM